FGFCMRIHWRWRRIVTFSPLRRPTFALQKGTRRKGEKVTMRRHRKRMKLQPLKPAPTDFEFEFEF
ncbi:hypothetical protein, partial [Pseudomonas mosselii]|uniref:hypothetical protein n=1 Tax=Pseudomonas mosselii TaxID=78327 RepID=UPI001E5B2663